MIVLEINIVTYNFVCEIIKLKDLSKIITYLPYIVAGAGAWAVVNGLLHDIFVLTSEHGKQYDRNLLRLLMDGHILITCGAVQLLCFKGLQNEVAFAHYIALAVTLSLVVYCAMIFPFLKSIVTTLLNLFVLFSLILKIFFNP